MDSMDYFTPDEIVLSRPHSTARLDLMKAQEELEQALSAVLRNVGKIKRISFDIGQTIVKLAYSATVPKRETTINGKLELKDEESLHMHCIQTRVEDFPAVLDYLAREGSIKYKDATFVSNYYTDHFELMIQKKLGLKLLRIPLMESLVHGTNFLIRNIEDESFTYDHHNENCRYQFVNIRPSETCPYLLVNVGTGISIYKVEDDNKYERIGGSSLGGGSFFGLAQLLTEETDHDLDELLQMAEDGDHRLIDTLVSDIYGAAEIPGLLNGDIIAGSFGKCTKRENADLIKCDPSYKKNAVRSLLLMISNSVGQLAVLYAQKEGVNRIYFDGFLIRNHGIIMRTISYSIQFWSQGKLSAYFLRHEGYTSAIGAYLRGGQMFQHEWNDRGVGPEGEIMSWHEYYHGCSELGRFVPTAPLSAGFTAGALELEFSGIALRPFYMLSSLSTYYKPDVANLNTNAEDRQFWLHTMENSVNGVMKKAKESQFAVAQDAEGRAAQFCQHFIRQIRVIREKSFAYGSCTVRNLLDLREQLLNEYGFDDSYLAQKKKENECALEELASVLEKVDSVSNESDRLFLVCKGLLAGNVFDWGAKQVVAMMEGPGGLSFSTAVETIPDRPWLDDGYDAFHQRMVTDPYRCAVIFVDNSGPDFLLGVIPFARELIRFGSKVIIVSNQKPALNDLTYNEMMVLVDCMVKKDALLRSAIDEHKLMFSHSGQASPCLDLRKVNSELNAMVIREEVDLVVIEGMGRALHTNYDAVFSCDSLKAAVIKTEWLADKMGGKLFSVVFKFEKGTGPFLAPDSELKMELAKEFVH